LLAPRKQREQIILPALAGVVMVMLPWIILAHYLYGPIGIHEALGLGYGDVWQEEAPSIAGQRGIGWAVAVLGRVGSGAVIAAVISFGWAALKLYRKQLAPTLPLLWLLTLVGLYVGWPTFLPEYFIDFFVPTLLLAALAIAEIQKHWPRWGLGTVAVILIATIGSMWSAYAKPWTGMFTKEAAREAAVLLQQYVPADEPVFTAAVIVPYLSGHDVMFNIAHPLWYRYDFIPPATKEAFLPPRTIVENELREGKTQWVLVEHLTDYAYLRSESRLISLFEQKWEQVTTIPNNTGFRSNTLKIYKRGGHETSD